MKANNYLALLRGINVGGHKKVPMKDLQNLLQKQGFSNVITILASGNVLFESNKKVDDESISNIIQKHFGFEVPCIILPVSELKNIAETHPFKNTVDNKEVKRYVSFIKGKKPVFTVVENGAKATVDLMAELDKTFGKEITTRNWNTIEKILKKAE